MAQELVAEADAMDGLVKKKRRAAKRWLAAGPVTPSTPLLVAAERTGAGLGGSAFALGRLT